MTWRRWYDVGVLCEMQRSVDSSPDHFGAGQALCAEKPIPGLIDNTANLFERTVVADHDMGMFEALVVGELGGDAGLYLFRREIALFRQSIDYHRL